MLLKQILILRKEIRFYRKQHIFADADAVNGYFAKILTKSDYGIRNVLNYATRLDNGLDSYNDIFACYKTERLLRNMKTSSPGLHGIPSWFFFATVHLNLQM